MAPNDAIKPRMSDMPIKDVLEEADRIINEAEKKDVVLRLFGGIAIHDRCPSASKETLLRRSYADIDVMGHRNQSLQIKELFLGLGYAPRQRFNALYGGERLIFNDLENVRRIDVFLDEFRMCHLFNLKDRLEVNKRTLTLADLLATKLQVVEATEREYKDIICIFLDHEMGENDNNETINAKYLAQLGSREWGVYTTFRKTLDKIGDYLKSSPLEDSKKAVVSSRIQGLVSRLDGQPKALSWKLRARVGEKTIWYELPEQDQKVVTD